MARSVIKATPYSRSNISFGQLTGTITRMGRLRIIQVYNGNQEQPASTWQLESNDYPAQEANFSNWVLTDGASNYGSRWLTIETNGRVTLSSSVVRGGFNCIYYTN